MLTIITQVKKYVARENKKLRLMKSTGNKKNTILKSTDTKKNGKLEETFLIIVIRKMTSKGCLVWATGTLTEITIKRTDQLLALCKSNQQKDPQTQRPKTLKI